MILRKTDFHIGDLKIGIQYKSRAREKPVRPTPIGIPILKVQGYVATNCVVMLECDVCMAYRKEC